MGVRLTHGSLFSGIGDPEVAAGLSASRYLTVI